MIGKVWLLGVLGVAVLAVLSQRQDIARYLKIKRMSRGPGHPEVVPADGLHSYPGPGWATPDGTEDFDSALRGGPAT
jgi:hypothetical protein